MRSLLRASLPQSPACRQQQQQHSCSAGPASRPRRLCAWHRQVACRGIGAGGAAGDNPDELTAWTLGLPEAEELFAKAVHMAGKATQLSMTSFEGCRLLASPDARLNFDNKDKLPEGSYFSGVAKRAAEQPVWRYGPRLCRSLACEMTAACLTRLGVRLAFRRRNSEQATLKELLQTSLSEEVGLDTPGAPPA